MRKDWRRMLPWAIALVLAVLSAVLRWSMLQASPFANGWDGYFYLIQTKALITEGQMHSPDASPVYPLLVLLYQLTGDYVTAFKLLSAGLAGLLTALTVLLCHSATRSWSLGLLAGLITVSSPSLSFFAAQFPKNLLGLNALLLLAWALLPGQRRRHGWAVAAFLLALLSHRMTAVLGLLMVGTVAVPWLVQRLRAWFSQREGLAWPRWWWAVAAGAGALVLLLVLPGLLHLSDLERFRGAFSAQPHWLGSRFAELMGGEALLPLWRLELIYLPLLLFPALGLWFWRRSTAHRNWQLAWLLTGLVLLLPWWQVDERAMGYRFVLSFLVLAPVLLIPLWQALPTYGHLALTAFLLFTLPAANQFRSDIYDPDYALYEHVTTQAQTAMAGEQVELVIAHKGLAEYFTFTTGIDALPWQPEYEVKAAALWRIAHGLMPMEYRYLAAPGDRHLIRELSLDYHLVREDVWQLLVAAAVEEDDPDLLERLQSWQNPHEERPDFLLRNKR